MITGNTLIASDRDITLKAKWGNYLAVDIKKGEPFYPRDVSSGWDKERLIYVPSFAGERNGYPEDWFYEYDAEYSAMYNSIFCKDDISKTQPPKEIQSC